MKSNLHKQLQRKLSSGNVCYVLITCDQTKGDGTLDVEMSYGGDDPGLASYLLSDAQAYIDDSDDLIE